MQDFLIGLRSGGFPQAAGDDLASAVLGSGPSNYLMYERMVLKCAPGMSLYRLFRRPKGRYSRDSVQFVLK